MSQKHLCLGDQAKGKFAGWSAASRLGSQSFGSCKFPETQGVTDFSVPLQLEKSYRGFGTSCGQAIPCR